MYKVIRTTDDYRVLLVLLSQCGKLNDVEAIYFVYDEDSRPPEAVSLLWKEADRGEFENFLIPITKEKAEEYQAYRVRGGGFGEVPGQWFTDANEVCRWFAGKRKAYSKKLWQESTVTEAQVKRVTKLMPLEIRDQREKNLVLNDLEAETKRLHSLLEHRVLENVPWHDELKLRLERVKDLLFELNVR